VFDTVLVANRGEIAVRIIATAKKMGLRTVAVYSTADTGSPHVRLADEAVRLGPGPATESYLRADAIIEAALATGAGAIHPGYGFLSEDVGFAQKIDDAGLVFVGPTPDQLAIFGAKHTARAAAAAAGVPMLPGTELLSCAEEAVVAAENIGYPVMLKATGGGGGIGMQACANSAELTAAFATVDRLARANFTTGGVFLERLVTQARHVEVQVFGDGEGFVHTLGTRDCSLQRRHQKVVEEAPAPGIGEALEAEIRAAASQLCASVRYRGAGTVEFIYDPQAGRAYFLEVNTRLQVEHPVTESVFGIDLVAWMLLLAQGGRELPPTPALPAPPDQAGRGLSAVGHSVEARIYAEDPHHDFRPSTGLLTRVFFPDDIRVDTWVETGTEITTFYDPLLAKLIAHGATREEAIDNLIVALRATRIDGIETNIGFLIAALSHPATQSATHDTGTLAAIADPTRRIDVLRAGQMTTVQDWPGRTGYWQVGVPPSGPMDDLSFRLGNRALRNPESAPGLECLLTGPALKFSHATTIMSTGAPAIVTVDGEKVPQWTPIHVPAGAIVDVGAPTQAGLRTYLLVAGGLDVPSFLGSASTFTLGKFGGHAGRALRVSDVLHGGRKLDAIDGYPVPVVERPEFTTRWEIGAVEGPHAAPEFFTVADIEQFYATDWEVHFNSARTGIRLTGPAPRWTRRDGGEAGLHPSNIHDTPYSVGSVNFTGDLPVILGPDGPSLGGFVCPATVHTGERWKLGQLRPGDTVRFVPIDSAGNPRARMVDNGILASIPATDDAPSVTYRRSGNDSILIEYGPMQLDLALRMRVHVLAQRLAERELDGIIDVTPGIRSLQIHFDPQQHRIQTLLPIFQSLEEKIGPTKNLRVPSRTVHLPLSWDDPATREAISRYMAGVRSDAPWCPWNIEFIRRINGLASVDDVHRTVFDAEYLVLGLGDVYLGAPVATPLDPRHRLVTTKYNPARTWTAENSVGIGGAYLCIYGMEGPGGYQFVGRTTQVWGSWQQRGPFEEGSPWLLRFFDRIKWYPVDADELLDLRTQLAAGRLPLRITDGEFSLSHYQDFLDDNAESIADFRARQGAAFARERQIWQEAGEFDRAKQAESFRIEDPVAVAIPDGGCVVEAPFTANVWQIGVHVGQRVSSGQPLLTVEAMKMESTVTAPKAGVVHEILVATGRTVDAGTVLIVLAKDAP